MPYADYLVTALSNMQTNNLSANAALTAVEAQAIKDQQTAVAAKGNNAVRHCRRALLRFLYLRGRIDSDLGSAMPPVAAKIFTRSAPSAFNFRIAARIASGSPV